MPKLIGELKENSSDEERKIDWTIPRFLDLATGFYYEAPVFQFLKTNWYLKIDPSMSESRDQIALYLKTDKEKTSCNLMCTIGIRKADGSMFGVKRFLFCHEYSEIIASNFISRNELFDKKSELLPSNNLIIICILEQKYDPMKETASSAVLKDLRNIFKNKELCDTTLQVMGKEFKAHKIILAARSPVFSAMFKHDTSEKLSGIISIPDCDPDSFEKFLEYLYSGELEDISFQNAFHLYKAADKYDVQDLKKSCIAYMIDNLEVDYICDVAVFAVEYDETVLLAIAQDFFNKNLSKIFATAKWNILIQNNFSLANKLLMEMASTVKPADNLCKIDHILKKS